MEQWKCSKDFTTEERVSLQIKTSQDREPCLLPWNTDWERIAPLDGMISVTQRLYTTKWQITCYPSNDFQFLKQIYVPGAEYLVSLCYPNQTPIHVSKCHGAWRPTHPLPLRRLEAITITITCMDKGGGRGMFKNGSYVDVTLTRLMSAAARHEVEQVPLRCELRYKETFFSAPPDYIPVVKKTRTP